MTRTIYYLNLQILPRQLLTTFGFPSHSLEHICKCLVNVLFRVIVVAVVAVAAQLHVARP